MPANFPEVWIARLIEKLREADEATFLDGIPELIGDVSVINGGAMNEQNQVHVAATDFDIDILINNNTYPIPLQAYNDETITIMLDKYQSKVVALTDDQTIGASYDKIDAVQRNYKVRQVEEKYQKAIHSIAPLANTTATPVIEATGGPDAIEIDGRLIFTYEDLVEANRKTKGFKKKRLVLCEDHWNDLLLDRKRFGDQLVNYKTGMPMPNIAGFEITHYLGEMPIFDSSLDKKAYGAAFDGVAGDKRASVIFNPNRVAKKTGITKQYFKPSSLDPENQTNKLSYRHYFIATPFQARYIAAIV